MSKDIGSILHKWHEAKEKLALLEDKVNKYKLAISKEMNSKGVDKITGGGYVVSRRRNTRSYLSKESVPENIWKEYATKCSYDAFFLVKQT